MFLILLLSSKHDPRISDRVSKPNIEVLVRVSSGQQAVYYVVVLTEVFVDEDGETPFPLGNSALSFILQTQWAYSSEARCQCYFTILGFALPKRFSGDHSRLPPKVSRTNLRRLLVRDFLQDGCSSCHSTQFRAL